MRRKTDSFGIPEDRGDIRQAMCEMAEKAAISRFCADEKTSSPASREAPAMSEKPACNCPVRSGVHDFDCPVHWFERHQHLSQQLEQPQERVAELENALVWSLGKLSIEVPVSGGNVTYIRAFEKASKALIGDGQALILRKQAEAVDAAIEWVHNEYPRLDGPHLGLLATRAQRLRQQADELEAGKAGGEQ